MKSILLFGIILISYGVHAQSNLISGQILYEFSHQRDTTNPNNFYKETMLLTIGNDASEYKSYTKMQSDSALQLQMSNAFREQSGNNTNINLGRLSLKGTTDKFYFLNAKRQLIYLRQLSGINYIVIDTLYKINWQVVDSFKTIGGYNCQKAIGDFRGRTYEAWFAQALPFPYGPWKLQGLPGLILEAYDIKRQVNFMFSELKIVGTSNLGAINFPKQTITTTEKEFEATLTAFREGAKIDNNSGDVGISATNNNSNKPRKKAIPINNHIELSRN